MAKNKYLLLGLEAGPNTWSVKTLNLTTLRQRVVTTCYEYVIPLAIVIPPEATRVNNNVNMALVCRTLSAIAGSGAMARITRLVTTNLKVRVMTMGLVETLSNDLGCGGRSEIKRTASVLLVYCKNHQAMRAVYNQIKVLQVPYAYVLPHEDDIFFGLDVFVKTFGKCGEPNADITMTMVSHLTFKEELIVIKRVYTPYGVYHLRTPTYTELVPCAGVEIHLLNVTPPTLDQVLPVVSMDIETIAPSCHVIPMGTSIEERLSSMVLYCRYGSAHYTLILFLIPPRVEASVAHDFCQAMSKKYTDPARRRVCDFRAFPSEKTMLYRFYSMYIRGGMMAMFNLPPDHPHVFVGHNIIQYDIPFVLERFKIYNMHSLLLESGAIVMPYSEQTSFNFCKNGLLFDSLYLARANCLSGTFGLSALAAARLPGHKVDKMELNSVSIRNLYNVARERKLTRGEVADIFEVDPTGNVMDDYVDQESGCLNLARFPINYAKMEGGCTQAVPRMETVLAYNIQDTITVMSIMIDSHVFTIISQLTHLFGVPLDASSMRGNSCRIGACMTLEALADGQFLYSLTDRPPPQRCIMPRATTASDLTPPPPYALRKFDSLSEGTVISANLTKEGFRGALNYAQQGEFKNARSFDFKSYYPNSMRLLNCDYGSVDVINRGDLMALNVNNSISRSVAAGYLDLYRMDDPEVDTVDLLDVRYRGREIGQCMNWDELESGCTGANVPILCILRDPEYTTKDSFLTKLITKRLDRRDTIKRALKQETDPTIRSRLDSEQLSEKILLNSKYGLKGNPNFHNKHVALSAAVTMFGRKFLTVCSRLITCYQILARKDAYPKEAVDEIITHLEYLKRVCLNCSSAAIVGGGSERQTFDYEPERFVCYVDTDGIKYHDPYGLDANYICAQINQTLKECLGQDYLALSVEPNVDRLLVLTCKSYATFSFPEKVTHTGYERNVNPGIKYILNSVIKINQLYRTAADTPPVYILFDIFRHLAMMNQAVMFERVKLNKHQNESSLKRYICSMTSDFRGDVATVMVLNEVDVEEDRYMAHAAWLNSDSAPRINTFKFIRKIFLVILRLIFINVEEMKGSPVAHLLIKETRDSYGGSIYSMNWDQAKVLGKIAFILCTDEVSINGANLKFVTKHKELYDYCRGVYEEYARRTSYPLPKCRDVTKDGMVPRTTKSGSKSVNVFFELFSQFQ